MEDFDLPLVINVVDEFIEYYNEYLIDEDQETIAEEMGNWCCKYLNNQDEVNEALDMIDEKLGF